MSTAVKEEFMQDSKKRMMALAVMGILALCLMSGCGRENDGVSLDEIQVQEEADNTETLEDLREGQDIQKEASEGNDSSEGKIYVFVCGEVVSPGVYELASDSRIYQAVEAAGGLRETAAGDYVNQAELMADGQRIYIPSAEEVQSGSFGMPDSGGNSVGGQTSSDGRVNLNTAGKEELMTLTGIGEKKAEAIIQYRDMSGGFGSIDELMQVEGIKEGTFEKIKEDIVI